MFMTATPFQVTPCAEHTLVKTECHGCVTACVRYFLQEARTFITVAATLTREQLTNGVTAVGLLYTNLPEGDHDTNMRYVYGRVLAAAVDPNDPALEKWKNKKNGLDNNQ
jgi:hypothetical protein